MPKRKMLVVCSSFLISASAGAMLLVATPQKASATDQCPDTRCESPFDTFCVYGPHTTCLAGTGGGGGNSCVYALCN